MSDPSFAKVKLIVGRAELLPVSLLEQNNGKVRFTDAAHVLCINFGFIE